MLLKYHRITYCKTDFHAITESPVLPEILNKNCTQKILQICLSLHVRQLHSSSWFKTSPLSVHYPGGLQENLKLTHTLQVNNYITYTLSLPVDLPIQVLSLYITQEDYKRT